MSIALGLTGQAGFTVGPDDTAAALGSGDVEALGTPRVVALAEAATLAALHGHLEPDRTSVGTRVEIDHLAPAGVGSAVVAEAELTATEDRKLIFTVVVRGESRLLAQARVERVLVERTRFERTTSGTAASAS